MNGQSAVRRQISLGIAAWGLGILAMLIALPSAARGRLPDPVATHWSSPSDAPDGSGPLWGIVLFLAAVWFALVLVVVVLHIKGRLAEYRSTRSWSGAALAGGALFLTGVEASLIRANLDRTDWRQAQSVTLDIVVVLVLSLAAGAAGWRLGQRGVDSAEPADAGAGPHMDIPVGQRIVWLSGASNSWIRLSAGVTGLGALGAVLGSTSGLVEIPWALTVSLGLISVAMLGCSSVHVQVTEQGLDVAFGPLGWPVRRLSAKDVVSATAEQRRPIQVGGWGYRITGKGTAVMLRAGQCLVVRTVNGREFTVSVDDAARGAALLNTASARQTA